ncbi:di-trans,poly-cis-decaprenylcistransferase [Sesbania bispinosa]|nr:di-trans,poly-cis-decaprenylcistransferase [Sesbania bispinosa]
MDWAGREKGAAAPLHVEVTVAATSGEAATVRGDEERPQTAAAKLGRRWLHGHTAAEEGAGRAMVAHEPKEAMSIRTQGTEDA